jgi:molecular chaperone GrpE
MKRKEHKIDVATPEEVRQYTEPESREPADAVPAGPAPAEDPTAALRAEADQWKDKALRAMAEMQNFQRRSAQERADAIRYANAGFARSLLDVVDSMERALEHIEPTARDGDPIAQALGLIHDNLLKVLREHNVTVIEAEGLPFDPAVHEAMLQQPSDRHDVPTVLQVLQKGYKLHDRVIRPAKVIVSRLPEAAPEADSAAEGAKE